MVSIDDFESLLGRDPDDWRRKLPVDPNEGCSCPKPLPSVLHVCRWCLLTKGAIINNPLNTIERLWMIYRLVHWQGQKFPLYACPKGKRSTDEKPVPFGASYRITKGRKRPSVTVNDGANPEIENL